MHFYRKGGLLRNARDLDECKLFCVWKSRCTGIDWHNKNYFNEFRCYLHGYWSHIGFWSKIGAAYYAVTRNNCAASTTHLSV